MQEFIILGEGFGSPPPFFSPHCDETESNGDCAETRESAIPLIPTLSTPRGFSTIFGELADRPSQRAPVQWVQSVFDFFFMLGLVCSVQFVAQHGNLHTMLDLQNYYAGRQ
ncbi:hypothetical protein BDV37DRAFT_141827 [Aspergillus pseudonomiae]|uniref:Uncharacterized protein n=1 Tax=Aspergillus pseudonomiae TaxID=1506151 RepID=A0A5N7DRM3_9EURO|nr:uncharacterized protein BDV37DRAFT_141827 [Aspergillus pseudonomiae]KAE8409092.1 hypothetical protein BDV37DRAFT_141827 [Aspergillus pseudonomiae]